MMRRVPDHHSTTVSASASRESSPWRGIVILCAPSGSSVCERVRPSELRMDELMPSAATTRSAGRRLPSSKATVPSGVAAIAAEPRRMSTPAAFARSARASTRRKRDSRQARASSLVRAITALVASRSSEKPSCTPSRVASSRAPSASSTRRPLAWMVMPNPSRRRDAWRSCSLTDQPRRASATAADSPASPAPTISAWRRLMCPASPGISTSARARMRDGLDLRLAIGSANDTLTAAAILSENWLVREISPTTCAAWAATGCLRFRGPNTKRPSLVKRRPLKFVKEGISMQASPLGRPGNDLLSRVLRRSTIGAGAFHGRVRNGIGCSHPAIITRSAKG